MLPGEACAFELLQYNKNQKKTEVIVWKLIITLIRTHVGDTSTAQAISWSHETNWQKCAAVMKFHSRIWKWPWSWFLLVANMDDCGAPTRVDVLFSSPCCLRIPSTADFLRSWPIVTLTVSKPINAWNVLSTNLWVHWATKHQPLLSPKASARAGAVCTVRYSEDNCSVNSVCSHFLGFVWMWLDVLGDA